MTLPLRRTLALMALVVALISGCGSSPGTSAITDTQANDLAGNTNQAVVALTDAGYVALTKQTDDKPLVMFRKCDKDLTTEDCRNNQEPSTTAPDVYLAVKDADATHLVPSGAYDLLFAASELSNPDNGLHCEPLAKSKLTSDIVATFATVGKQFHGLKYKTTEGGSPQQTKLVDGTKWRCSVTFGQYL